MLVEKGGPLVVKINTHPGALIVYNSLTVTRQDNASYQGGITSG